MLTSNRKCGTRNAERGTKSRFAVACLLLTAFCLLTFGCRYDMQDQPRYKVYKRSDFWGERDPRASRDLPEGTVARGFLREDKALYTGKKDNAGGGAAGGGQQQQSQTTTDARGNTVVTTFPDAIDEFPIPVTKELIDRGQERYTIYCQVCHGPTGNGDGLVVRRGFSPPPTYNDDRLRNAPVGHFFDVITNGWGKMNSYAAQVPVADRWAIVAYIRALQISQNPSGMKPLPVGSPATTGGTTPTTTAPSASDTTTMTNNTNANTTTGQQQQGGH
jgi:mono/diheme cytochrome c family protein